MNKIHRADVYNKLNENRNQIFSMLYQKANGEMRKATCRLHVSNPKHCQAPGAGQFIGESAREALEIHNNIKYFDLGVEGVPTASQTPGKGGYRTAKIDRIHEITVSGVTYEVID